MGRAPPQDQRTPSQSSRKDLWNGEATLWALERGILLPKGCLIIALGVKLILKHIWEDTIRFLKGKTHPSVLSFYKTFLGLNGLCMQNYELFLLV